MIENNLAGTGYKLRFSHKGILLCLVAKNAKEYQKIITCKTKQDLQTTSFQSLTLCTELTIIYIYLFIYILKDHQWSVFLLQKQIPFRVALLNYFSEKMLEVFIKCQKVRKHLCVVRPNTRELAQNSKVHLKPSKLLQKEYYRHHNRIRFNRNNISGNNEFGIWIKIKHLKIFNL